jgi:alkylation response protein AidB-like acyl-CoA dehydrogenase
VDFELTPAQAALKESAARFGAGLNEDILARDAEHAFPREAWRACAAFGLQGLPFPTEYGGKGLDALSAVVAMEGLGYSCRDSGLLFGINAQMWSVQIPLVESGSDGQKQRYLPGLIDGSLIGAHAMSEPEAGSDAFSLSTTAARRDGGYVLDGRKAFITNGAVADVFLIFATVDKTQAFMGVTAFLVDRDLPGVSVSPPVAKMGLRTAQMADLRLEGCFVPESARLGREGGGSALFNASMEWERAAILANYVGAMEHQLERCIEYSRTRRQFGRPIADFAPVAERLAAMKARLETSRLLIYRVAWLKQTQGKCPAEAAMAKLYVSEAWTRSCEDAVRIHGGYGFLTEAGLERDLRDSIGGLIYSGTSDIQRGIIGRLLWSTAQT